MLRNELHLFEDIIFLPDAFGNQILNDLLQKCKQIESSWQDAAFPTVMEQTLDRYFQHYLTGISKFSDTLFTLHTGYAPQAQTIILNLIDHLRVYYTPYFNLEMTAPVAYCQRIMNGMSGPVSDLQYRISGSEVSPDLKTCLSDWIQSMSNFDTGIRYSFRSLKYFQILNQELSNLDWNDPLVETLVINLLIQFNFNHLAFFAHMQCIVRSGIAGFNFSTQLTYLEQRNANMLSAPQRIDLIYDPNWPGIQIMLSKWFAEEITLLKIVISKETESSVKTLPQKLSLNLSVAQLSCLIRLFYEEQIFTTTNLTAIFSFVSTHFQTKKQTAISRASLSKEYYSLDQHTAARVLDVFQKMVFRINRNFFPVAAVISTIVYGCLGTH